MADVAQTLMVIDGHPNPASLCAALTDAYVDCARGTAAHIDLIRLRELRFDPILRVSGRGAQRLEPDLVDAQRRIEASAHLTVVTPLWWGSIPALLKGFFDRILVTGWAFSYDERGKPQRLLAGRSASALMTTDSPGWYLRLLQGDSARNQLVKSTLKFCGFKPVAFDRYGRVIGSTQQQRETWLRHARLRGEQQGARLSK